MTSTWGRRGALVVVVAAACAAPAQAQIRREFGIEGAALAADPGFAGGGFWGALRPSARLRLGALALMGDRGGTAFRGEAVAHFLLDPARRHGAALYAGGGIAAESGPRGPAWVVAAIGVEGAPGAARGWVAELGVGGGVRIAVGWRWRSGARR